MTLAELDRALAQHGQMLPLDVADRARATVGGLVATNAYGRRRQRYGTAKDLIVGVGIVRPDGVARAAAAKSSRTSQASICRSSWWDPWVRWARSRR